MKKLICTILLLVMTCTLLTSCGAKAESDYNRVDYYDGKSSYDSSYDDFYNEEVSNGSYNKDENVSTVSATLLMTYKASVEISTYKFDENIKFINDALKQYNGYITYQSDNGGYYSSYSDYYYNKNCYMTIKIPAEYFEEFINGLQKNSDVTSFSRTADDITSQYLDTQARLSSLETQRAKLEELLKKTGSLTEMLEVEKALAEVIYQIESYTSQMNYYKDLVAYSEVTIWVNELATVQTATTGFGERLKAAFGEGWKDFVSFVEGILVGLASALPFLLVLAGITVAVIASVKRKKKAKAALKVEETAETEKQ